MKFLQSKFELSLFVGAFLISLACMVHAEEGAQEKKGTMSFSSQTDTDQRSEKRIFPLLRDKMNLGGQELPPLFGIMFVTNWMDSDWKFQSAAVSVGGTPSIYIHKYITKHWKEDLSANS